jgi:hypothetical protein
MIATALAIALSGCAGIQVRQNAVGMVDNINQLRRQQVLRNLSEAITDHDFVPSDIILGTGTATASVGATPSFKSPGRFLMAPARELDISATDTWSSAWQMTPVTDSMDLRNLRNLYALVTSTDRQYYDLMSYFLKHKELQPGCSPQFMFEYNIWSGAAAERLSQSKPKAEYQSELRSLQKKELDDLTLSGIDRGCLAVIATLQASATNQARSTPSAKIQVSTKSGAKKPKKAASEIAVSASAELAAAQTPSNAQTPASVTTASWEEGVQAVETGDSIDCKYYQQDSLAEHESNLPTEKPNTLPFRRWLYWKQVGERWGEDREKPQPDDPTKLTPLGVYGRWELWTASPACFDDFVILVQQVTPKAAQASLNGPRIPTAPSQ